LSVTDRRAPTTIFADPRMKTRLLLCLVLALTASCRSPSASRKPAPDVADTKVRLYGEALTARDAGDLTTARARLQALIEISPNDPGLQRLLASVETAIAAPPPPPPVVSAPVVPVPEVRPALVAPVAANPAPAAVSPRSTPPLASSPVAAVPAVPVTRPNPNPAPVSNVMPAVIEEPAPNAVPRTPPDPRTQALVRVEAIGAALAAAPEEARTEKLMSYIEAQRALAAEYAKEGNFIVAVGTLDAALAAIRISTEELRGERAKYVQEDVKSREGVRLRHKR
jgi:hypothetical protein